MSICIEADTMETFETITKNSAVCVLDFYAPWCGPCKSLLAKLEKAIPEDKFISSLYSTDPKNVKNKITFLKVNIDNFQEFVEEYNIDTIPLVYFYKNGTLCKETVNEPNVDVIIEIIVKYSTDLQVKSDSTN